jgi:hypothetical protein
LGDPVKGEGSQKLTSLPRAQRQQRAIIIVAVIQIRAKALGEHGHIVCRSENLSRDWHHWLVYLSFRKFDNESNHSHRYIASHRRQRSNPPIGQEIASLRSQ